MSRKDFIKLAAAIANISNDEERINTATLVGRVCEESNKNFDWSRWNKACRVLSSQVNGQLISNI